MTLPKYERNFKIVKLRLNDPKKYTWDALRKEFGFKSRGTVKEIFDTFLPKYEKLRTYPQKTT